MIRQFIVAMAAISFTVGTAVAQAPVQMRGGGIQGQARNSTWTISPDGIAHFANIDPASGVGGISVDSLVQKFSTALSQADIGSRIVGYDANGRIAGALSPSVLYMTTVSGAQITAPGSYAPMDLPLTLTVAGNALGQTAQIVPNGYTVTSAAIAAAGNNCPAATIFTLTSTGTRVIVSDGNGLAGSVITVSVGGSAATAASVPANPVALTTSVTGCTPPKFTLGWGLADISIPVSGWGYTGAPVVSAPASTLPNGTPASVVAQIQTSPVNLADKTIAASMRGQPGGVAGLDQVGRITAPSVGDVGSAVIGTTGQTVTQVQAATVSNAAAVAQAQATASAAIPSVQIGASGGVAGLDNNQNVTANLLPGKAIMGADAFGNYLSNSFPGGFDPARSYEADLIGGNQSYPDGTIIPRQVLQQTDPYGPYSAGCGYALNMLGSVYTSRNPVSEQPPEGGAASLVSMGGFDTVAHCILFGNQQARLVLPVASYTATSLVLKTPLTASQAAQIHPSMYITTNSPNPALTLSNTPGTLPKRNLYAGLVRAAPSAGDTVITVWAWEVTGWGTGAAGQVPQTTTLDTVWSKYTQPVVFIGGGAAGSAFANNWYAIVDARDLIPSATNKSLIHQFTMDEEDGPTVVNGTAPAYSVDFQGHSMNAGNQPAALTLDSYEYLFGGNIHHHVLFDGAIGNWLLDGDNIFVPSLKYQPLTTVNPTQSYQIWQMPVGVGTKNKYQMVLWNDSGNPTAADGWQRVVTHFGPTVDGAIPADGDPGGSKQGDIEWNAGGDYGSVSLCAFATNCGLKVGGNGVTTVAPTGIGTGNGLRVGAQPSGHVSALGVYAPSGYSANLMEIFSGTSSMFQVSAGGTVTAAGAGIFGNGVNVGTAGITSNTSTGAVSVQLYPTDAGDWNVGTQVGGGGNIRGVNGYYGNLMTLTGALNAASATVTGTVNAGSLVGSSGTFNGDVGILGGHRLNLQPATISNGLVPAWCAPSSYVIGTCSTIGAMIYVKASGDFESTGGTSSTNMSDGNISGLHADGHGNWNTTTDTAGGGAFGEAQYTLANLPTTETRGGVHVWCSDCKLNGILGVEAYWHATASKWTDSQNNALSN